MKPRAIGILLVVTLIGAVSWAIWTGRRNSDRGTGEDTRNGRRVTAYNLAAPGEPVRIAVSTGNGIQAASSYYAQSGAQLGLDPEAYKKWTLPTVAAFYGYPGFSFVQEPCDAMAQSALPGEVLSFRYFAPKTSTLTSTGVPKEFGFRQVFRLNARKDSEAQKAGLSSVIVLANYFIPAPADSSKPPANKKLEYFQVALLRQAAVKGANPTYFLLFSSGGSLQPSIKASFFGGDGGPSGTKDLYVPDACLHCHGELEDTASLNFFDVDHWHDRVKPGNDFSWISAKGYAVIETGACNPDWFSVMLQLNKDVATHDSIAGTEAFVQDAIKSRIARHDKFSRVLSLEERAYGNDPWSGSRTGDIELIGLLNRYCYRCHGSKKFDVFNRSLLATDDWRKKAIGAIQSGEMPMDRRDNQLTADEKKALIDLITHLR